MASKKDCLTTKGTKKPENFVGKLLFQSDISSLTRKKVRTTIITRLVFFSEGFFMDRDKNGHYGTERH